MKPKKALNKPAGYDYSNFNLAKKEDKEAVWNKIVQLVERTRRLTAKDIADWRYAWQMAITKEMTPRRERLYDIYEDISIDGHLSGAIDNQRKLTVLSKSFLILDKNGKEREDLKPLFETPWVGDFMDLVLDSIFWGYSLIQFNRVITSPVLSFESVELVPRNHVIPEYNVIVKEIYDEVNRGINYLESPVADWCIPIGNAKNLGLLNKCCPKIISKKNVENFWDEFAEMFGMPMRTASYQRGDERERRTIEEMLINMGSAAWGVFPEGVEINYRETTNSDSFNVYDKRIDRVNSEISKLVLGQTMTLDDGSSLSQSQVHERVAENIVNSDAKFLANQINFKLFPFLIAKGFPIAEGDKFQWNENYTIDESEVKLEEMLLKSYDIPGSYFETKYGIPVQEKKNLILNWP